MNFEETSTPVSGGNTTEAGSPYLRKYWLICESLLVIFTFIAIYLIVCLVKHAVSGKSNRRAQHYCQKVWLKWLCVFSAITLFLRLCCDQLVAFIGWHSDASCLITVTVSTIVYMLSFYSIYIFLWVRQSVFYADAIMKEVIPQWIVRVSWFTLVFMLITGVAAAVAYNLPQATGWEYRATSLGCEDVSGDDSIEVVTGVAAACSILFQIVLLALFIYPLLSREMARFRGPESKDEKYQTTSLSHSGGNEQPKDDDDDDVFHANPAPSAVPPVAKQTPPISPLAFSSPSRVRLIRTPRVSAETDAGTESGAELVNNDGDRSWTKNTTIKRGETIPAPPSKRARQPKRKSVMERFKSVRPGGAFYHKARRRHSSENSGSPAVSDTETRSRGGTLRRVIHKENRKGRKLVAMMKRYAVLMLVCIFTDIVSVVFQSVILVPELVYLVLYDFNLMVNLLCIVITFAEWRSILLPCPVKEEETSRSIQAHRLRRKPTPPRKLSARDRVQALKQEGRRSRQGSNARRSSGSGYESGDSGHSPIYRPVPEARALIQSKR